MAVNYSGASPTTFSGVISGTGTGARLVKEGTGTLVLTGNNTYEGATNVDNGTLRLGGSTFANQISDKSALFVGASGIFDLDGRSEVVGGLSGSGQIKFGNAPSNFGLAVNYLGASETTFSGVISGSGIGGLIKRGTGTLILAGNNTYTGETRVEGGTLKLGASDRISDSSALRVDGNGIFNLNGHFERVGGLSGSGQIKLGNASSPSGLAVDYSGSIPTAFIGVISGTGAGARVLKEGTGTLILGGNNTYEGGTDIIGGTLQVANFSAALGSGGLRFDGGTLRTTADNFGTNRAVTLNTNGTIQRRLRHNTRTQGYDRRQRLTNQDRRRHIAAEE